MTQPNWIEQAVGRMEQGWNGRVPPRKRIDLVGGVLRASEFDSLPCPMFVGVHPDGSVQITLKGEDRAVWMIFARDEYVSAGFESEGHTGAFRIPKGDDLVGAVRNAFGFVVDLPAWSEIPFGNTAMAEQAYEEFFKR